MVSIRPKNKRYHAFFEDEELGRYTTCRDHTFMPSSDIDLGEFGIPYDLPKWHRNSFEWI
jgi:hypothetical protein